MALSVFSDRSRPPAEKELSVTLDNAFVFWNGLQKLVSLRFAPLAIEWGFSSPKTGWGLRLKQEKRTILYMIPCKGYFLVSFALGEKAVKAAHDADLPASVLSVVDNAKKYAEGSGVRLEVRSAEDVCNVEKLAVVKIKN